MVAIHSLHFMNMNSMLRFILASILLFQVGHAEVRVKGGGSYRPSRPSENLMVNTDPSLRYVTKKSEHSGIQDIVKLISESKYEEEWIFLPKESTWYEIGVREKSTSKNGFIEGSLYGDPTGLEKALADQPLLKFFHFHPMDREAVYELVKEHSRHLRVDDTDALEEKLAYLLAVQGGLPSDGDLQKMSRMYILNNKPTSTKLSYNTVSVLGVFEYSLSPEGLKRFKDVDDAKFRQELKEYKNRFKGLLSKENFDIVAWLQAADYRPFMHHLATNLSSKYVIIRYLPFDCFK
jgi:hypothetical protein